jgi:adenosylcobinamide kinase/adenosylcobinamide-phosphate guanylyltransferase
MKRSVIILGGIRSGKSRFALKLSSKWATKAVIATAEPFDEEMENGSRDHIRERGDAFLTIEAPEDPGGAIASLPEGTEAILLDCIGVWLGNLFAKRGIETRKAPEISSLLGALEAFRHQAIIVSQEANMGLIGMDPVTRSYQETLGLLNQKLVARAETAVLMVAGVPVVIKGRL